MRLGPLEMRLEPRLRVTILDGIKISVTSIAVSFLVFSVVFFQAGANPLEAYQGLFIYAFGTGFPLTMYRSVFLIFVTLGFILPLRAGIWNIGMTGQFYVGSLGAFGVAHYYPDLAPWILIPLMLVAGAVLGGITGAIPGFLKGKMDVNEIVTTLMINLVAFWLVKYFIEGPWIDPGGRAESHAVPVPARAPLVFDLPFTTLLAVAIAVILFVVMARTKIGYEVRAMGSNPKAARYAGISRLKISLFVLTIGGALAGLAGYHVWAGIPGLYKIPRDFVKYGDLAYYGIISGLVSLNNPIAAILTSIFLGAIVVGSSVFRRTFGILFGADLALLGVLLLALIAFQFFYRYRVLFLRGGSQ